MTAAIASVVIPAHDEGRVIDRTLRTLLATTGPGELEVVVVANGCADDTAAVARAHGVRVVEIAAASKIAALNAGDDAVSAFPRVYLDADVELGTDALRALAALLRSEPGPLVAAPRMRVDASRSSAAVRMQQRVWELSDFRRVGHVGSGVYAVSAAGRARFGRFPDVIADDRFVQQRFAHAERGTSDGEFVVRAPRTMRAAIRRSRRAAAGNAQLVALGLQGDHPGTGGSHRALVGRVLRRPALWPAFVVYCYGHLAPRIGAAATSGSGPIRWDRDETSRA